MTTITVLTVRVSIVPISKEKTIYQQVLKLGANEASVKGLQNALQNECHAIFLIKLWVFENNKSV